MDEKDVIKLEQRLNESKLLLSYQERLDTLRQLKQILVAEKQSLLKALQVDLGKSNFEAYATEIAVLLNEIDYVTKYLKKWMKPSRSIHLKLGYIEKIDRLREPYGNVLIISPWNYPLQLALMPAINAIAAGNSCVIKPSEFSTETSKLLQKLAKEYFTPEQLMVVTGDAKTAKKLISLNFDFLFFTGSESVGRKVYKQVAEHLTPTVMELGGKSPCIVDESGFSREAMRDIVWGKFLNAGQTCIAPDTLYIQASVYEEALAELKQAIFDFYGEAPQESSDYGRIVHQRHFDHLSEYIKEGHVYDGGAIDRESLFIAPTIVTDPAMDSKVLKEEIFGPILPVVSFQDIVSLLDSGLVQHDALTGYLFSTSSENINLIKMYMASTVSVNQVIHHAASPHIPFGGSGRSGFGAYHGRAGFEAFTYDRSFYRAFYYVRTNKKYPPHSKDDLSLVSKWRKWLL